MRETKIIRAARDNGQRYVGRYIRCDLAAFTTVELLL